MTTPVLGFKRGAGDVVVNLEILLETRLLIQASSGAGKSWMIRYLLEQTHGRVQHIVIDREGDFVSMREKFPYLLVGPEGDLPADRRSAKLLAKKLLELKASAILDLSEMTPELQREYVATFCRELAHLPREFWTPCIIVIDEAHLFAPQKRASEATSPVEELTSLGRKRGYCVVLATQRLAKLDKDVAGECLNKLIGRVSDIDAKRAGEELDFDKKGGKELRQLEPGEFWAYGPAIASDPVKVKSGPLETTPPKRGELRPPAPPPTAKIKGMLEQLRDLPQQAAEEARTVAQLQKDNAQLRAALTRAEKHGVERVVEKKVIDQDAIAKAVDRAVRAERLAVDRALVALLKQSGQVLRPLSEVVRAVEALGPATAALRGLQEQIEALRGAPARPPDPATSQLARGNATAATERHGGDGDRRLTSAPRVSPASPPTQRQPRAPSRMDLFLASDGPISGVQQKILDTVRAFELLGIDQPDRVNVAAWCGYHMNAKSFSNALGANRSAGLISYPEGGKIALTDEGRALANDDAPITSLEELHEKWFQRLSGVERKILEAVMAHRDHGIDRDELAAEVEYHPNAKSFANSLGRLRSLGLITKSGPVKPTQTLYPEALV